MGDIERKPAHELAFDDIEDAGRKLLEAQSTFGIIFCMSGINFALNFLERMKVSRGQAGEIVIRLRLLRDEDYLFDEQKEVVDFLVNEFHAISVSKPEENCS